MNKFYPILAALLLTASTFAQTPEKISYQTVVRDASNALVTSTAVGMQISILQTTSTGTAVYVETQTPTSNANGLVSLEIGNGTVVSGAFSTIDWANGPYFIKREIDPEGGIAYTITGTSELLSVPYALHAKTAKTAENGVTNGTAAGEMQYWDGTAWVVVAPGSTGQVLKNENGVPEWKSEVGDNFVINNATGKIWMDRNLGATQVATSPTDASSYGDLYQWGRGGDGHQIRTPLSTATSGQSSLTSPDANFLFGSSNWYTGTNPVDLWKADGTGVNNPCPTGYRLPTQTEWTAEIASWGINNDDADGAFASRLKLPMAGGRNFSNGSLNNAGPYGFYWSSTVSSTLSRYLYFNSSTANMSPSSRASGLAVRCLKD